MYDPLLIIGVLYMCHLLQLESLGISVSTALQYFSTPLSELIAILLFYQFETFRLLHAVKREVEGVSTVDARGTNLFRPQ